MPSSSEWEELLKEAARLEKYSIARTITFLEREDNREIRKIVFPLLRKIGLRESACTIGITGTPGAGKSSLIGEIVRIFLESTSHSQKSMAVVAIDPSSHLSGGSILGDRTRVILPKREKRIYFRSQPSQLELGGVNPYTYHVIRLLRHFFDFVLVETVGIGQNEIEVSRLSDLSFLVLQPLGGDQIQFMKSGIMEVPDAFILNKVDEEKAAESSYHMLLNTLEFLKEVLPEQKIPPVFRTSVTRKIGIPEVWNFMQSWNPSGPRREETVYQLERWIRNEYGRYGIRYFRKWLESTQGGAQDYETMEDRFLEYFFRERKQDWVEHPVEVS